MKDFNLDDAIGYQIERTEQCLKRELRRAFSERGLDITPYQWTILYRLWEREGETQAEIAETTIKDKPTITRMLDLLEKKQLVYRERDKNDRRVYKIYLTDSGKELKSVLPEIVKEHLRKAGRGIPPEDLEKVKEVLTKIRQNFENCN
jgi:DNA-binding MarR family transcriptional regulator